MQSSNQAAEYGARSRFHQIAGLAAALALVHCGAARADQNLMVNGSFEIASPYYAGGTTLQPGSRDIEGWTVFGGDIVWGYNGLTPGVTASEGLSFVDIAPTGAYGAGVSQQVATVAGTAYRLSFDLGLPGYMTDPGTLLVETGPASASGIFSIGNNAPAQRYERFDLDFTAAGASTTLRFSGRGGLATDLDNVVLTTISAVPELSTWELSIAGLLPITLALRRRVSRG